MTELLDLDAWRGVLVNVLNELGSTLAAFLPKLIGALVILGVGWLVSRAVAGLARRGLGQVGFDRVSERLGIAPTLRRAGLPGRPSALVARLLFWALLLVFLLSGAEALGLRAVTTTIDRVIAYLPNVIAAVLIVILGLLLGRFARNLVSSGAAAARFAEAPRLGAATHGLVVIVVGVLALEQLGIETELLVTVITVAVATLGLTTGVAFALGARQVVTHILAGHYLRQSLPVGRPVEVQGRSGIVQEVGAVATLMRDDDRLISVPNARLLDEILLR